MPGAATYRYRPSGRPPARVGIARRRAARTVKWKRDMADLPGEGAAKFMLPG